MSLSGDDGKREEDDSEDSNEDGSDVSPLDNKEFRWESQGENSVSEEQKKKKSPTKALSSILTASSKTLKQQASVASGIIKSKAGLVKDSLSLVYTDSKFSIPQKSLETGEKDAGLPSSRTNRESLDKSSKPKSLFKKGSAFPKGENANRDLGYQAIEEEGGKDGVGGLQ